MGQSGMNEAKCGVRILPMAEVARKFEAGEELSDYDLSRLCRNRDIVSPMHHARLDEACLDSSVYSEEDRKKILQIMHPSGK
jgi:hypothetical protein